MTREFEHYQGCCGRDPDNCSGCALTHGDDDGPNYSGWPLVYMENHRAIPSRWKGAFNRELNRTDNPAYVANLHATMAKHGIRWK